MSVFPLRRLSDVRRMLTPASVEPTESAADSSELLRSSPADWARRRRAERGARRIEAAGARAISHLQHLGPSWHLVDWPRAELSPASLLAAEHRPPEERTAFLAIGPSGVFAVSVTDNGRSRVLIAGDVIQINGKRPTWVADARRDARRVAKAMSNAIGFNLPVTPVLTFVGSGVISVYGLPKECLITTHRELDRLLVAGGNRISPATAEKLARVAQAPSTWGKTSNQTSAGYPR
jgi:hypothetical protein